jgi:hypothetical protein
MDNWNFEVMAELRREELISVMRQIRLEQEAEKGSFSHPGRFARAMAAIGLWMIAFGQKLCQRYAEPWPEVHPVLHSFSTGQR